MGAGSGSRGGRGREAPSASTRAARTGRGAQTLASVRRERILESLRLAGAVSLGELAEMLAVSDMTVRRDLEALHRDGLIERVRGGAVVPQRGTDEPGFDMKLQRQSREKRAIADVAATMVRSGAAIGLSAGTTTWALARRLATTTGITVVTNSMNVWGELQHRDADGPSAVLSGGEFRTPSDALVGPGRRSDHAERLRGGDKPNVHLARPAARRRGRSHEVADLGAVHDGGAGRGRHADHRRWNRGRCPPGAGQPRRRAPGRPRRPRVTSISHNRTER